MHVRRSWDASVIAVGTDIGYGINNPRYSHLSLTVENTHRGLSR